MDVAGPASHALRDGWFQQREFTAVRVEFGRDSNRYRPLLLHVPDRESVGDRDAVRFKVGAQHLIEAEAAFERGVAHLREMSDGHSRQRVERTRHAQVAEHAVDAIQIFADVFQEENRAAEFGEVPGSDQRLQQRKVAARQPAGGAARNDRDDASTLGHQRLRPRAHPAEPPRGRNAAEHEVEVISGELRHLESGHRAVKGHHSRFHRERQQENRDVGIADDRPGPRRKAGEVHTIDNPVHAFAASQAPHRINTWVSERGIEISKPVDVAAAEIAMGVAGVGHHDRLVAECPAKFDAPDAVIAFEQRTGRGEESHPGAGSEPRWQDRLGRHTCSDYD